ncbi:hypothetical protein ACIGXI_28765 [Kitasatospora aureofaciens]|uniref:SCO4402 family protein n=1 Tax=Kitasatospora aureofaciens TaxID=1894 RepID=UPI0037C69881
MIDHGIALPDCRLHVVHVLFGDFCDAHEPAPFLGGSLRTEEEVELMALLGAAYGAVQDEVGASSPDEAFLDAPGWRTVVSVAARLAQVMLSNDYLALARLLEAGDS